MNDNFPGRAGNGRPGSRVEALRRCGLLLVAAVTFVAAAGTARSDMIGHGGLVRSIAMSPDGTRTLTASFDYSVRLWRFDEQRTLRRLDGHDGPVNAVAFLGRGETAVSAGSDGRVIFWSLGTGSPLAAHQAHLGRAMSVAVAPRGDLVLSGGWDGRMILWNPEDGSEVERLDGAVPLVSVGFAGDGDMLVAADRDGAIQVRRRSDGIVVGRRDADPIGLTQMVVSADGRRAVTIGLDNSARVWSLPDLEPVTEFLPDPEVKPLAVAVAADGSTMLVAYVDGRVLHLDARTGGLLREFRVETAPAWTVAFTPDGRFALLADASERVGVWHLATGDRIDAGGPADPGRPAPWLSSDHPGAALYRKCANCHALTREEIQRSGPHFAGLFGRRAGTVEGYRYSEALRRADVVWGPESLRALFAEGPDRYLPGTKMPVQRIPDARALDALIDYLAEIAPPP